MADLRTLGTAIESYLVDNGHVPAVDSLEALAAELEPTFVRALPRVDGWGTPFRYQCWRLEDGHVVAGPPTEYVVRSPGRDRAWEHEDVVDYELGPTTDFRADILFGGISLDGTAR